MAAGPVWMSRLGRSLREGGGDVGGKSAKALGGGGYLVHGEPGGGGAEADGGIQLLQGDGHGDTAPVDLVFPVIDGIAVGTYLFHQGEVGLYIGDGSIREGGHAFDLEDVAHRLLRQSRSDGFAERGAVEKVPVADLCGQADLAVAFDDVEVAHPGAGQNAKIDGFAGLGCQGLEVGAGRSYQVLEPPVYRLWKGRAQQIADALGITDGEAAALERREVTEGGTTWEICRLGDLVESDRLLGGSKQFKDVNDTLH